MSDYSPKLIIGEFVALGSAALMLAGFFALPWDSLFEFTGKEVLDMASGLSYGTSLLWLVPISAAAGSLAALGGLIYAPGRRVAAVLALIAGIASLLYFVSYFGDQGKTDFVGVGFWLALVGAVGLVIQIFIPRRIHIGQSTMEQRQRLWGWAFLSPWIIGFLVFTFFPMAASLYFSFTDYTIGETPHWIGLKNWQNLFKDPMTYDSLRVTLKFGAFMLPVSIFFPLLLAALLNSKYLLGKRLLRVLFYMPYMVPAISGAFIWQSFLNGQTGLFNRILREIGYADPPDWLFNSNTIQPAMVMVGLWGVGNAMLTMLAGMQGVPTELYEAAQVDGAGPARRFLKITIPMISPVILYNLVLTVIGLMQYFVLPYVLSNQTRSNPETNFINLHLYREAFQYFHMGYASALAWFLFAIALGLTLLVLYSSRRWVYYSGG